MKSPGNTCTCGIRVNSAQRTTSRERLAAAGIAVSRPTCAVCLRGELAKAGKLRKPAEPKPKRPRPRQANHVTRIQIGDTAARHPAFATLKPIPLPAIQWREDVPADRSGCPPKSPDGSRSCGHVNCSANLWHVAGDDTPGRRWENGRKRLPVIRCGSSFSCLYDVLEVAGGRVVSEDDIGSVLGISGRQIRRLLVKAVAKLADNPLARQLLADVQTPNRDYPVAKSVKKLRGTI